MQRKRRSSRFGLKFFRELAILLVAAAVSFFAAQYLTQRNETAGFLAVVVALGVLISPLCRRVRRGLFSSWRRKEDLWANYYRE